MNFLDNNLRIIFKNNPPLKYAFKQNITPLSNLRIIDTPSGNPTGILEGLYIHSRYDPGREAVKIIRKNTPLKISSGVILGFGLGYLTEAFLQQYPHTPLLVVEPDISFFLKALSSRDMSHFLDSDTVVFILGSSPAEFSSFIPDNFPVSAVQIYKLRSVFLKNDKYYIETEKVIKDFIGRKKINNQTLQRFGKLWVKNLVKNVGLFPQYPGVSALSRTFNDIPAIIVAAGPSLDTFIGLMPEISKRTLLIAVDTAVRPLLQRGIKPDFIIIVDPQYWNTKYLERITSDNSFFIAEPATHPRVFELLSIKGFFAGSLFPLGRYFESIFGEKGTLGAGGSVTTTAWDFARLLGCSPIYIAGMDLSFPFKRTHCKETSLENMWYHTTGRTLPVETNSFLEIYSAAPFYTYSFDHKRIISDQRMMIYQKWFENQFRQHHKTKTYILTGTGLKLNNTSVVQPDKLLELSCIREHIDSLLSRIDKDHFDLKRKKTTNGKLYKSMADLIGDLKEIENLAGLGITKTIKLQSFLRSGKDYTKIIEELNEIDKTILSLKSRNIAGFLLQKTIHDINSNINAEDNTEILNNSLKLYRELKESVHYHIEILRIDTI